MYVRRHRVRPADVHIFGHLNTSTSDPTPDSPEADELGSWGIFGAAAVNSVSHTHGGVSVYCLFSENDRVTITIFNLWNC